MATRARPRIPHPPPPPSPWSTGPIPRGTPAPECIHFDAPRNCERISPAQADPYDAFFYIAHKRANSDYLAVAYGEALGSVGALGSYTQKISSMTLQADTTTFQIFASTGNIEVLPGSSGMQIPTVNRAARSFEDIERGIYAGQETSEGADITLDENPTEGEFAGHVSSWGSPQRVPNRQGLLDEYGHDLFSFSAYYLGGKTYTVTITNGDEEPITLQVLEAYEDYTATITVAGSVTIDIVAD